MLGMGLQIRQRPFSQNQFRISILLSCFIWVLFSSLFITPYAALHDMLRLWLPFSIFFYLSTSIAIFSCLEFYFDLFKKLKNNLKFSQMTSGFSAMLAILLLGICSIQEIRTKTVYNIEADSFHDAKAMAAYLKQHATENDAILAACPLGFPLYYEFSRLKLPVQIASVPDDTGSLASVYQLGTQLEAQENKPLNSKPITRILVIETPNNISLDIALAKSKLKSLDKKEIKLLATFPRSNLYEIKLEEK